MSEDMYVEIAKLITAIAENAPWIVGLIVSLLGIAVALYIGNNLSRARDIRERIDRIIESVERSKARTEQIKKGIDRVEGRVDDAQSGITAAQELIQRIREREDTTDDRNSD